MALLKEPYDEWKRWLGQCCYNQDQLKNDALIRWNAIAICEVSKTSWQKGKFRVEDDSEDQRTNNSFLEQWLNITWFQHEIKQDFISLARTFYQESIFGMHWSRWNLERRHFVADIEELEKMGASEFFPRRINAKGVLISHKGEELMFPIADGTGKLSGRDYEFREPTPRREQTVGSEDLSGELEGEPGKPRPAELKDDAEARADFWSIRGDFIYRHHNEPRVLQLYMPLKKHSLFQRSTLM